MTLADISLMIGFTHQLRMISLDMFHVVFFSAQDPLGDNDDNESRGASANNANTLQYVLSHIKSMILRSISLQVQVILRRFQTLVPGNIYLLFGAGFCFLSLSSTVSVLILT